MNEIELQKSIVEFLNYSGHFVWRNNAGMFLIKGKDKTRAFRAGKKGSSDIIGIHKSGKFIALEVKLKGNKPTPQQNDFIAEIKHRDGIAGVVYSLDEVIELVN